MNWKIVRQLLALTGILLMLLTLPGCSGCSAGKKDGADETEAVKRLLAYSSDEIRDICRIRLTADKIDFYEGEDGSCTLTVTIPKELLQEDMVLSLGYRDETRSVLSIPAGDFKETKDGECIAEKPFFMETEKSGNTTMIPSVKDGTNIKTPEER